MSIENKLEVIDREGWRKEYPLQKTLTHIGSDAKNDIILEEERGAGVMALHAQLVASADGSGCRLVNLGNEAILLGYAGEQSLAPRSILPLNDGQVFKLGDFVLIYRSSGSIAPAELSSSGSQIGLTITLPQTRLAPLQTLRGIATVRNLGDRSGAKFDLELEGLEPDCYEIEPGPLLPAGAEKDVSFILYHRGSKPLAGERRLTFRAAAPNVYPVEQTTVSQTIQILPYYHHKLQLLAPHSAKKAKAQAAQQDKAEPEPSRTEPPRRDQTETGARSTMEDWWTAEAPPSPPPGGPIAQVTETPPQMAQPAANGKAQVWVEEVETVKLETGQPHSTKAQPEAEDAQAQPVKARSSVPGEEEKSQVEIRRSKRWWVSVSQYLPFARPKPEPVSPEPAPITLAQAEPQSQLQVEPAPPAPIEMQPAADVEPAPPSPPQQEVTRAEAAAPAPVELEQIPEIEPGPPLQAASREPVSSQAAVIAPEPPTPAGVEPQPPSPAEPVPVQAMAPEAAALETGLAVPAPEEQTPPAGVEPQPPMAEQPAPEVQAAVSRTPRVRKPRPPKAKAGVQAEAQPAEQADRQPVQIEPPDDEVNRPQEEIALEPKPLLQDATQPLPAVTDQAEDWWSDPDSEAEPQQTKIPAAAKLEEDSSPEEVEQAAATAETISSEPDDDWWSAEPETPIKAEEEKRQVIKLKATAETEAKKEAAPAAGKEQPAKTEDWWSETDT